MTLCCKVIHLIRFRLFNYPVQSTGIRKVPVMQKQCFSIDVTVLDQVLDPVAVETA